MTGHERCLHTNSDALADRIDATKRSWLPISGHVVNVTLSLDDADRISTALRSAPAVSTGEPVAWRYRYENEPDKFTTWYLSKKTMRCDPDMQVEPLYAAPASGDVRAAVIEAWRKKIAFLKIDGSWRDNDGVNAVLDEFFAALSQAPATDAATSEKNWNIFDAAMMMLEDVPGETMLERIAKLKEWYLQLQMGSRA